MPIAQQDYEKLGAFYLGREVDSATGEVAPDPLLYESRDLTTHGVIIGMTGSGKTGLGIALLEEAAMDRIPVIAIDPKGDLGNLLLTFPDLTPGDFRPWINEDVARQKAVDPDAFAASEAENWRRGLADWDQDGARIAHLRSQVDLAVYTPGSAAGRQVSVLRSFDAPPASEIADDDAFRERILTTVTGLLGLLGIDADPIRSRDHILLSAILDDAWRQGRGLDLGALIQAIQQPPFTRLGVMELESVYPANDRFALAMRLNALLASPSFQGWLEGEPLDIPSLLYTEGGHPRVSIFSIAHLGDAERMFFVTMLLSAITGWMRTQPGTTSLRALVYMDEIFGFFPPVANPPSKAPMLTLLKQARAFGVGMVLATQNPVDLDYKGLGNTGTWFIGRLQTDRDKQRVLEALDGAMAGSNPLSRSELDRMISGLGKRVFLMHNVHRGAPRLLSTRWVMSYLAGPLTLAQIRTLHDEHGGSPSAAGAQDSFPEPRAGTAEGSAAMPAPPAPAAAPAAPAATAATRPRPILPPEIRQFFISPIARAEGLEYRPAVLAATEVRYSSARHGVDETRQIQVTVPLDEGVIPFSIEQAATVDLPLDALSEQPIEGTGFSPLPGVATQARSYGAWGKQIARWIQGAEPVTLLESSRHRVTSRPGESEREFRMRLADLGREARDAAAEKLRQKYDSRFRTLEDRLRRAEQAVEKRSSQAQQALLNTGIAALGAVLGAAAGGRKGKKGGILGAFLGGGTARAGTAIRGAGRVAKSRQDVDHAEETVEAARDRLTELEEEFQSELQKIELAADAEEELTTVTVRPTLTGISVTFVALVWMPWGAGPDGAPVPLWR